MLIANAESFRMAGFNHRILAKHSFALFPKRKPDYWKPIWMILTRHVLNKKTLQTQSFSVTSQRNGTTTLSNKSIRTIDDDRQFYCQIVSFKFHPSRKFLLIIVISFELWNQKESHWNKDIMFCWVRWLSVVASLPKKIVAFGEILTKQKRTMFAFIHFFHVIRL